jgi:hypothetical protein
MELVEVTVFYLEMLAPSHRPVPAPRAGLTVLHASSPTVPYYRSLYDVVGKDYHWLSRRKLSDEALAAILGDPEMSCTSCTSRARPPASPNWTAADWMRSNRFNSA